MEYGGAQMPFSPPVNRSSFSGIYFIFHSNFPNVGKKGL